MTLVISNLKKIGFEMALESINVCLGAELPRHSISERWSCDLKRSVMANSIPLVVLRLQAPCALSETSSLMYSGRGGSRGRVQGVRTLPPPARDDLWFSNTTGILQKKNYVVYWC